MAKYRLTARIDWEVLLDDRWQLCERRKINLLTEIAFSEQPAELARDVMIFDEIQSFYQAQVACFLLRHSESFSKILNKPLL